MQSKKMQGTTTRSVKKLLLDGIVLGAAIWLAPALYAQNCDNPGCACRQSQTHSGAASRFGLHSRGGHAASQGHLGHHQNCQAVTVIDRIDSWADRFETGIDRVFGKVLPKKKSCTCAQCQLQGGNAGLPAMPFLPGEPVVDPGVDSIPEPDEPGIADPLSNSSIEATEPRSYSNSSSSKATSRPRVPLKVTDPKREFPTSTEPGSEMFREIRPKQPAVELRPLDRAPHSSNQPTVREPGVYIPEWLDDPFKEDQSRRESIKPQRMLPPAATPPGDIRWTQRPTLEQQSQKVEVKRTETVAEAAAPEEPVIKLKIGDTSPALSAAGQFSDRDDRAGVVKASAHQPIRITFPVKKL